MRKFAFSNAFYDEEAVSTSSKMAQLQASQSPGFIFVNVSGAKGDEKRKHMQKVVRSAATSYSHRVQPRGTSKSDIPLKVVRCGPSTRATDTSRIEASEDSKIVQHGRTVVRKVRANMANISRKRDSPTHKEQWSDMPHRYKERSLSPGPVSLWISDPSLMDASIPDPFDSYPVKYRKWYGQLINFVSRHFVWTVG
ncbi:hypothetical protein DOTSEDRAFT_67953 [Dothistroma septosporum NZE10]|uniref:Uncharacterized protein n=1 Tax=Dothistroma septosporum (strain NZE10 / CBS 128990) TaxID=675120 RepID=N1Q332_DOTSN|nr:hypothetical protein DOTSEDRAFT_67953 [Dothistroma septosporum NZE10]